jgi:predicted acylesterase/phospholipase RssA
MLLYDLKFYENHRYRYGKASENFDSNTKIVDALLASSSAFPGIVSLKLIQEPFSDGGILNHFPTDLLQGHW